MSNSNGVWTIGRRLAVTIIVACLGMSATGATVTWKAASWAEGIEQRLKAIDDKLLGQTTVSVQLIDVVSRLAVCEARIDDMRSEKK